MSRLLDLNSVGPDVAALQQSLKDAGFNPGSIDGSFDLATQAAVLGFQQSEGLSADGVVGPKTARALQLASVPEVVSAIPGVTVQVVSRMFPSTPIGNVRANLPFVLSSLVAGSLVDKPMVLMALSTIRAETAGFEPISEGRSLFNTSPSGHPFDLYDNRKDLGNTGQPDGARFCGRGFIQLTGRANYTTYGQKIGKDLVGRPELANDPAIAADLLSKFIGDREDRIREALAVNDLRTARRLVNGGSHGLDQFENAFKTGSLLIPDPQVQTVAAAANVMTATR